MYLGIKPALHQQYLSLKKMVTQKMLSLLNTQIANQKSIYESLRHDNLRFHSHVQDLTRELQSTIAAQTLPIRTPGIAPNTPAASDSRVAAEFTERLEPRQAVATASLQPRQNTTPAPVFFHLLPRPAATDVQRLTKPPPIMTVKPAANITGPQIEVWQTVNRRRQTVTVGKGTAQEKTVAAECPTPGIKPFDNRRRILFPQAARAAPENGGAAFNIALEINKALYVTRVSFQIRLQRLAYNKEENLSGLTGSAVTSNMLLQLHRKLLLLVDRK